jgi:putative hydrolase of the HAD superfamily
MGTRKPETAIYEQVLQENDLKIENTVLLDDNWDNIGSARAMGMSAVHILPTNRTVLEVFAPNQQGDFQLRMDKYWD